VSLWPPKAAVAPPEDRAVQAVVVTGEAVATVVVTVAVIAVVVDMVTTVVVPATEVVVAPEAWVVRAGPAAPQEAQALRVMAEAVVWAAASGVARDMEEAIKEGV